MISKIKTKWIASYEIKNKGEHREKTKLPDISLLLSPVWVYWGNQSIKIVDNEIVDKILCCSSVRMG